MYNKILVPVDGSPTSVCGLHEAISLAKDQHGTVRLVHVVDEFLMDSGYGSAQIVDYQTFLSAVRETGKLTLDKMVRMSREQGIEAESELLETIGGRAADLIIEAARSWPADLIVMGTHGRRGVRRLLMGSDAELVLHSAPVPVLMIRGPVETPT
jgi:nucleotide-binding universal stress UspA family protein